MSSTAQETFQNGPRSQFLDPSINTLNPQSSVSGLQPLPSFSPKQRRYTVDRQTATTSSPRADLTSIKPLLAIPESPKATTSGDPVPASFLTSFVHSSAPLLPPSNSFPHSLYTLPKSVEVQCKARTRVPTPHGPVFLHIYHNNLDSKEHLAIVIDPGQLDSDVPSQYSIRSKSLDAVWNEHETDMDRLVRGAYIGRLSSTRKVPSAPFEPILNSTSSSSIPPIVRIHSECYTGETIGSMRCDCGEQLDEAIRCISKPQLVPSSSSPSEPIVHHARGAVIYMRQEGRGIGLLEKIRAYNLQDMGYDTVQANLLLGHGADERGYEIAAAIMRDLGLGTDERGVRILTNNPDKMEALRREGIVIKDRLPMIPRTWTDHTGLGLGAGPKARRGSMNSASGGGPRRALGATMIGGGAATGIDLERYLRTKVEKMGHLLELPTHANPGPPDVELVVPDPGGMQQNSSVLVEWLTPATGPIPLLPGPGS